MINGANARLVVFMMFLTLLVLIISITLLAVLGDNVPVVFPDMAIAIVSAIGGAVGINFQFVDKSNGKPPTAGS